MRDDMMYFHLMHDACNCTISISKWLRDWLENVLDLIRAVSSIRSTKLLTFARPTTLLAFFGLLIDPDEVIMYAESVEVLRDREEPLDFLWSIDGWIEEFRQASIPRNF
jgi:hypothetical protein